ncbi:hypothetical protein PAXRUDRAFT_835029 [Paxillus rubicundulus Ve08.2h10]|uniref:Protein kinase domain-containing protein n=1 Tax=Paxillus rubicundulus Ve08.2h10 TaxID=930991 RepID=A0A0D0CPS0_9AGAM|nr:hypothetical protein PAXRUDRAFT_835029 [Paxillus rubicundulus Ve08.2h10]
MAAIHQSSRPRNIVFFGDTGVGKSSTINLIAGSSVAVTNNDTGVCTLVSTCYKTTIRNEPFNLWDMRGLSTRTSEQQFNFLFKASSEGESKRFLRERYQKREIDLLVYCIRGSGGNEGLVKNYNTFCAITRRLAAPVVVVVTNLERENTMEDWWERNGSYLRNLGMEFDGHACITTIPNHPQENVSKTILHDLIARNYPWQREYDGSYFGSPVRRHKSEVQSRLSPWTHVKWGISEHWMKATKIWRARQGSAGERSDNGADGLVLQPLSPTSTSSYYTAPQNSQPTTPIDGPPTHIEIFLTLPISTRNQDTIPSQSSSEESGSTTSHSYSTFGERSATGCSSSFKLRSQPLVEGRKVRYRDLTAVVKRKTEYPIGNGGFGDIWECDLMIGGKLRMVAVKSLRPQRTDAQHLAAQEKKLGRELRVWDKLQHENVVELLGIVHGFGVLPSMVSPWFSNGSLSSYLSKHEAMDLSGRQGLLFDIASGLRYLHSQDVVHGDLHSGNVLVDDNGRACLTDFGLSVILQDFPGTSYLKSSVCGALRYADPDLVRQVQAEPAREGKVVYPTKPSDIYSFGGLTLSVLSGKQPYEGIGDVMLCTKILRGDRPPLDERIPPKHASLIQRCWSPEESMRPLAEEIVTLL